MKVEVTVETSQPKAEDQDTSQAASAEAEQLAIFNPAVRQGVKLSEEVRRK